MMNTIVIKNLSASKKRNKIIYTITTNEEEDNEYIIDEDTIVKYEIIEGREFDSKIFKKIIKEVELSKLTNKCFNYLNYGMKTKHQIYEYLNKQNDKQDSDNKYSKSDYHYVIERLESLGYIDDLAFSKNYINEHKQYKGRKYIERELNNKGVDSIIIIEALNSLDEEEEYEAALKIANKLSAINRKYPLKKQEMLLSSKLARDGFSSEIIRKIITSIELVDDSSFMLEKDLNKLIKKYDGKDISVYEKRQKILASLLNKGYSFRQLEDSIKEIK